MKLLESEYATYRSEVREYFNSHVLTKPMIVLDPMAGTAPLIPLFETRRIRAYLNDILPVHFYVNWLKTAAAFNCYTNQGAKWFGNEMIKCLEDLSGASLRLSDQWLEDNVLEGLIKSWNAAECYEEDISRVIKGLIVLCIRPLASITKTSNPTWYKKGGVSSSMTLKEVVDGRLELIDKYYRTNYSEAPESLVEHCTIMLSDATQLEVPEKADVIITSPPYCNRLDLFVQYGPELYFLSFVDDSISSENLIASTRVRNYSSFDYEYSFISSRSKYASKLLSTVMDLSKSGEQQYYLRYYTRYFYRLYLTLENTLKYLLPNGQMYMVLQDNSHRGVLIETDKVIREVLAEECWRSRIVKKWERTHLGLKNVTRSSAFVKSRQYEKVLVIKK